MLLGSELTHVNGADVRQLSNHEVRRVLAETRRPVTLSFVYTGGIDSESSDIDDAVGLSSDADRNVARILGAARDNANIVVDKILLYGIYTTNRSFSRLVTFRVYKSL